MGVSIFEEVPIQYLNALEKEMLISIYFLVTYARFGYTDILSMNLSDFSFYFNTALESKKREEEEMKKLDSTTSKYRQGGR